MQESAPLSYKHLMLAILDANPYLSDGSKTVSGGTLCMAMGRAALTWEPKPRGCVCLETGVGYVPSCTWRMHVLPCQGNAVHACNACAACVHTGT